MLAAMSRLKIEGGKKTLTFLSEKRHALRQLLTAVEKELLKKPNRKTLDRLSLLAGFQDWESFQEALHGEADAKTNYNPVENKKETTHD